MNDKEPTQLTDRKVVRRGLIAGLATLGAAVMVKVSGADKAEAAHEPTDVGLGIPNPSGGGTTSATTLINAGVAQDPGFMVVNGGSAASGKSGIIGVSDGSSGAGVRGINDTVNSFGVEGNTNAASGNLSAGVRGVGMNNRIGVAGVSNVASDRGGDGTGSGTGVAGKTTSGVGVEGYASGSGRGVYGHTDLIAGGIGVDATSGSVTGYGLRASNWGIGTGTGVLGVSDLGVANFAGIGAGTGVHGKSGSGTGVFGESQASYGVFGACYGSSVGVLGAAVNGAGVWGQSNTYVGVYGNSLGNATGVFGISQGTGNGVFGESALGIGMYAIGHTAFVPALYAQSVAGSGQLAGRFDGSVVINGNHAVTGSKSAIVPHPDGVMRTLYCQESPEAWFEDFGRGQLAGGRARIRIDSEFAPLVVRDQYMVFLTAEGETRGLFIAGKDPEGFSVQESAGGTSNTPFSYRIVARRADAQAQRLAKVPRDQVGPVKVTKPSLPAGLAQAGPPGQKQNDPGGLALGRQ